jgi:NADH:ubiquinone oxidoreductase subunit C
VTYLYKNCQFWHLATVTGVDLGENFEITYHLDDGNTLLSLKTRVPKSDAKIDTITDIIPGAVLYERELYEMFGVLVNGHPDLRPVMLPDGWPKDLYPLRKEVTLEKIKERLGEGTK